MLQRGVAAMLVLGRMGVDGEVDGATARRNHCAKQGYYTWAII